MRRALKPFTEPSWLTIIRPFSVTTDQMSPRRESSFRIADNPLATRSPESCTFLMALHTLTFDL